MNLDDIRRVLKEHKTEVCRKYRVLEIGVFGSYVRGDQKERSDIDILVSFSGIPDVFKYMELLARYWDLEGRLLGSY